MVQAFIHYGIHLGLPLIISILFFKSNWKFSYIIMLLGLLIDVDHFMANPIFNPNRCSINFHPLHSYYAVAIYIMLALYRKTRLLGIGLVIHIIADATDCLMM